MKNETITVFTGESIVKAGDKKPTPTGKLTPRNFKSYEAFYSALFKTPAQAPHKNSRYIITAKDVRVTPGNPDLKGYWKEDHFHRNDKSIISTFLIPIDGDKTESNADSCIDPKLIKKFMRKKGYSFILYTTYSHSKTRNRWRLLVPCVCKPEYYKATCLKLANIIKDEFPEFVISNESMTLSQPWYIAEREDPEDGLHYSAFSKGKRKFTVRKKSTHTTEVPSDSRTIDESLKNIESGEGNHLEIRDLLYQQAKDGMPRKLLIVFGEGLLNRSARKNPAHKDHSVWLVECNELEQNVDGAIERAKEDKKNEVVKKPLPKTLASVSRPIPKGCVPNVMFKAAKAVADYTKMEKESAILTGLVAISTLLQKKVVIHEIENSLVHNCAIGAFIGSDSGGRKTETYEKMNAPLFDYEKELQEEWKNDRPGNEMLKNTLKNEIENRERIFRGSPRKPKTHSIEELTDHAKKLAPLKKKLDELNMPKPSIYSSDITEERFISKISENGGAQALFSDDGRNVVRNILGTRYNNNGGGENTYIQGLTGGEIKYERKGAEGTPTEEVIRNPCTNLCVFVQNDMIEQLIKSDAFILSGLAARILIYIQDFDPVDMMNRASQKPLDISKMQKYYSALRNLCKEPKHGKIDVYLSEESKIEWVKFSRRIGQKLSDEWKGEYDLINKIGTFTVKFATIFMAINEKNFMQMESVEIPLRVYRQACDFVEFATQENLNVHHGLELDRYLDGAETISRWISRNMDKPEVCNGIKLDSYFQRNMSKKHRNNLKEIFEILELYGHVYMNDGRWFYVE